LQRQQSVLCQKVLADTGAAAAGAEAKATEAAARLAEVRTAKATFEASVTELAEALTAANKRAEEAVKRHTAATEARAATERDDVRLRENLAHAVRTGKKAEEAIQREVVAFSEARAAGERAAAALPAAEAAVARLEAEKATEAAAYEAVMSSLRGETEGLRVAMEAKQAELAPCAEAAAKAAAALATTRTELRLLQERLESAGKALEALHAQAAALERDLAAKRSEVAVAAGEASPAEGRRAAGEAEMARLVPAEAAAAEAARVARGKLEEGKAATAAGGGGGGVVDAQLKLASKAGGALAGVKYFGRLGDLGTISAEYDVAISTACGSLNWLVVGTTTDGQACVEYLRAKNLGRAKFICLDKVSEWAAAHPAAGFEAPAGGQRLYDLVTVKSKDDRIAAAFYFSLRDTLVAADIDTAVRIAYRGAVKYRVVTLAGELMDISGTMAGGGGAARKGGMAATAGMVRCCGCCCCYVGGPQRPHPPTPTHPLKLQTAEELAAAERDAAAAAAALTEVRGRKTALAAELRELERAAPKLATRVSKLTMELAALEKLREDVAGRIAAATAAAASGAGAGGVSAEDTAELARLTTRVAGLEKVHGVAAAAAAALEAAVAGLQRDILETGGERVRRAKARLDRASEAVEEASRVVTKATADGKAAEKAGERAKKVVEKAKSELLEAKAAHEKVTAELAAVAEAATAAEAEKVAAGEARTAAEGVLSGLKSRVTVAERELKAHRDGEREAAAAWEEADGALRGLRKKLESWSARFEALKADYVAKVTEAVAEREADAIAAGELPAGGSGGGGGGGAAGSSASATAGGGMPAAEAAPATRAATVAFDEPLALPAVAAGALAGLSMEDLQYGISVAEAEREALAKKVNMGAMAEYRTKNREYLRRVADLDAITKARDAARATWEERRKARLDAFMAGFSVISLKLKEMYQMITLGGDAELELVDTCDPFAEGILFQVRPPKKSWKNICNLSGGEKTLSSLALVFALHHYKPTPLYVMDEIDAALDFKNVSIVANYIKERTKDAQFIIISLRNNMFELADRLVGIYKTHDVTKSVTINPKKIAAECGLPPPSTAGTLPPAASGAAGAGEEGARPAAAKPAAAAATAAAGATGKVLADASNRRRA